MNWQDLTPTNNIYIPGLARAGEVPEEKFTGLVRTKTWYSDEEVAWLPFISRKHPRHREWLQRQHSCRRLIRYLALQKKAVNILEIGCGNGWLSYQLSTIPGSRVIGLDPDYLELTQAARVFRRQPNLKFIYGDFHSDVLQGLHFDIIVIAASIELLAFPDKLITTTLQYLSPDGEIHILDSRIRRTHELVKFPHRYLYDPGSVWNRLFHKNDPHPWICIKHP